MNPEPFGWRRRPTREVRVGDVGIGGSNPIRVQSMTTPETADVTATAEQIRRLARAGCEIVRVTVPTSRDAAALPEIRAALSRDGIRVPLAADIHFSPAAAMMAVEHVEKVRINPGNYADRKKFKVFEISDADYAAELERIEQVFRPLVLRAKQLGVAMRIGTNHGSLSDRIMNRYGDTPLGMVESALEFVRICEAHGYRDLVLSMKSSNPQVVIQAYRLLAARMAAEGMDYPFHLGVTEAGDGEDGRIKSAIGIGALLEEGIGDTIRVSLTEDPVEEVPVAFRLVEKFNRRISGEAPVPPPLILRMPVSEQRNPFQRLRRACREVSFGPVAIGGGRRVAVELPLDGWGKRGDLHDLGDEIRSAAGAGIPEEQRADFFEVSVCNEADVATAAELRRILQTEAPASALSVRIDASLILRLAEAAPGALGGTAFQLDRASLSALARAAHRVTLRLPPSSKPLPELREMTSVLADRLREAGSGLLVVGRADSTDSRVLLATPEPAVDLVLSALGAACSAGLERLAAALDCSTFPAPVGAVRLLAARLDTEGLDIPLVLLDAPAARGEDPTLGSASFAGSLLCDGIGDSLQIAAASPWESRRLALGILQGARVRISRTEFISCPSCGRTQFDLETTTRRIKERTAHLKGLKIAIMGCVVNGPGEMADADFGYVGWGKGKVSLFVGKEMVARDIPTSDADERLIELIKRHGRWVDPPASS